MAREAWRVGAAAALVAGALVVVAQPAAAAQFTVSTTADSGVGSLRQAVLDANASAGADAIVFAAGINTQAMTLTSGELPVTGELTVTGNGATNTIIDGNASSRIFNVSGAVPFTVSGATLQHGVPSSGDGGAIKSDGTVTVDATAITDNTSTDLGGGVAAADVTIRNGSVVRANHASLDGGGALGFGAVTITNSTISHNTGRYAGGVGSAGALTITDSTVSSNAGIDAGGGAFSFGAVVTISGSWFDQNTVIRAAGAGFARLGPGTTVISDSTFSNNEQTEPGGFGGGAIALFDTSATLTNVTMSGNSADGTGGGGGIAVLTLSGAPSPDTVTIGSSTIDGNVGGGIAVAANAAATTVGSTVLSNNTGPSCDGSITDAGFNLLFNTTAGSCVFDAANDVTGADPDLDALALNAPAALVPTMALSASSPAQDVVTTGCPPPATDARGVTRPQGDACDIGAFELAVTPPPPTITTTTPTTTTPTTTPTVAPATGENAGSGDSGTLPATGGPGPGLALFGTALLALGVLLEFAPRARARRVSTRVLG